ncbi:MAG: pteridine reductase [Gammaproteobacteria bacterium]|nr:pteridine reductase [Gammaproteobacteria bacterium]
MNDSPVALVTGSARRIGAAINRRLHADGYSIAIHCRNSRDDADTLAQALNNIRPGSALVVQRDLNETANLRHIINAVLDAFGRLDLLVNNASSFYPTPLDEISEEQFDDLVGSNLKAPLFLSQAALPALRESNGSIVNIVDIHAQRPLADHPAYLAAKAGLHMLTRSMAKDLGPGIRVNGVAPGAILWPETEHGQDEAAQQAVVSGIPLGRTGRPEDIADAVAWLAQADYVSGQVIAVDGGRSV